MAEQTSKPREPRQDQAGAPDWLTKNLILIMGKGGVGKTTVATATAKALASRGKKTLLCHILQLTEDSPQELCEIAPNLFEITLRPADCFQEYVMLKLRLKPLYTVFLGNKVTQYLERAAPGVREMVLLGKVWFDRNNYDHIVVDMPSTGYALTMVHTPFNFAALFPGGPIYTDSQQMVETLSDPSKTAFVSVSLAEEMPLQESLDLAENLKVLMPQNPSWLVVNRLIEVDDAGTSLHNKSWPELTQDEFQSPLWQGLHYLVTRSTTQRDLLNDFAKDWRQYTGNWVSLPEVPQLQDSDRVNALTEKMQAVIDAKRSGSRTNSEKRRGRG